MFVFSFPLIHDYLQETEEFDHKIKYPSRYPDCIVRAVYQGSRVRLHKSQSCGADSRGPFQCRRRCQATSQYGDRKAWDHSKNVSQTNISPASYDFSDFSSIRKRIIPTSTPSQSQSMRSLTRSRLSYNDVAQEPPLSKTPFTPRLPPIS